MYRASQLIALLGETLNLGNRTAAFDERTKLLGSLPEMDSMGVVAVLTALEDQLGVSAADDEIDGKVFESVGTLLAFVRAKQS